MLFCFIWPISKFNFNFNNYYVKANQGTDVALVEIINWHVNTVRLKTGRLNVWQQSRSWNMITLSDLCTERRNYALFNIKPYSWILDIMPSIVIKCIGNFNEQFLFINNFQRIWIIPNEFETDYSNENINDLKIINKSGIITYTIVLFKNTSRFYS